MKMTSLTAPGQVAGNAGAPSADELPPNRVYYAEVAPGVWRGRFKFSIDDYAKFLKGPPSIDKVLAFCLHVASSLSDRFVIDSGFRCPANSAEARAFARVTLQLPFPAPPVDVYRLQVRYQLDADGVRASGVLREELGPIPRLFRRESSVASVISGAGLQAEYSRIGFGTSWQGVYKAGGDRNSVDVRYVSEWGQIRYRTRRLRPRADGRPPRTAAHGQVEDAAARMHALRARLEVAAFACDDGDMVLPFIDTYIGATLALTDAVQGGVLVPSARTYDVTVKRFRDANWVATLGELFAQRFLDALEARRRGLLLPVGWRRVFPVLAQKPLTEIDAVALCMYAHVLVDLPSALAALADDPALHIEDYDLVNFALSRYVDTIEAQIAGRYGPVYAWLDTLAGHYDEVFVGQRLHEARAKAWYFGMRLRGANGDARTEVQDFIERLVELFVESLISPRPEALAVLAHWTRSAAATLRRWKTLGGTDERVRS